MHLFLLDAVDRGVIRKSDGLYKYDDKMLGGTLEATITLLRDPRFKAILNSIKRETYPELLPKQDIQGIINDQTNGIPYFEDPTVEEPLTTSKATKTVKK